MIRSKAFMMFRPSNFDLLSQDCGTLPPPSAFEQDAVLRSEGDRHRGAFIKRLGRRATHRQLPDRAIDDVLDEIAMEQALTDRPGDAVAAAVQRARGEVNVGGADGDPI